MYNRGLPGRKARTASQVKEEAAAQIRRDREKRKLEAEERRRSLSVGSISSPTNKAMTNPRGKRPPSKGGIPIPSQTPSQTTQPMEADAPQAATAGAGAEDDGEDVVEVLDTGGMGQAQAAFFRAMEERLKQNSNSSIDSLAGLLQRNIERIDNNAHAIREIKKNEGETEKRLMDSLDSRDKKSAEREALMEKRITEALTKKLEEATASNTVAARAAVAAAATPMMSGAVLSRREAAFDLCRRSLKAWPVSGEDLQDAFRVFLSQKLGLSDPIITALGEIKVERRPGKVAAQKLEVLATFISKEERDLVKGAGPNLAGQENVGLMIHVPGHLLDHLHVLNNVGYNIKQKFPGTRRAVKFDDENQDLFMDIKVGEQWKRITPTEAKQVASEIPKPSNAGSRSLSVEDLSSLLQGEHVAGITAVAVPADEE